MSLTSSTSSSLSAVERAQEMLRSEWSQRGELPLANAADWLRGPWSDVLTAVELKSRSGSEHLPLSLLLQVARDMACSQSNEVAA